MLTSQLLASSEGHRVFSFPSLLTLSSFRREPIHAGLCTSQASVLLLSHTVRPLSPLLYSFGFSNHVLGHLGKEAAPSEGSSRMKGLSPSSQDPSVSGSLSFLVGKGAGSLALVLRRLQFSRHEHTHGLSQELTRRAVKARVHRLCP